VLTVEREQSTLLVPFHPELMVNADHHLKILVLTLPEGLL
jgi:ribosomal 30S subunit maturation factor RimM